jgi:hypothetical protein
MRDGMLSSFPNGAMPSPPSHFKPKLDYKLKSEEQSDMMQRLHDLEATRRKANAEKLAVKYMPQPPSKKLTKEAMDEQVERVFKQAMTNHNSRMNNVLAKHTTKETRRQLTGAQMEDSIERLYRMQMEKAQTTHDRLRRKYYDQPGKSKRLTADELGALTARVYDERKNAREAILASLQDEYVTNVRPWDNGKRLNPSEVALMADRLSAKPG